jgi:hypothetical protein
VRRPLSWRRKKAEPLIFLLGPAGLESATRPL